jgi:glycosyltransferase involved in cell wall biosynthesis
MHNSSGGLADEALLLITCVANGMCWPGVVKYLMRLDEIKAVPVVDTLTPKNTVQSFAYSELRALHFQDNSLPVKTALFVVGHRNTPSASCPETLECQLHPRNIHPSMSLPRVTIGIPVFNGEAYISQAIESILGQTFTEFELIVSDNGSTDKTEQICRQFAAKDQRIRYYREEMNRGAAWNHNRLVELARGEYFKWQCCDDFSAPHMIARCVSELDRDPDLVLCYGRFVRIDKNGAILGTKDSTVKGMASLSERFHSLILRRDACEEIYGVQRTAVARQTRLIGPYTNSDDTFLAEMILRGKFGRVPEPLIYYRLHAGQSTKVYKDRVQRMKWFNPAHRGLVIFPSCILLREYLSLIRRAPLPFSELLRCYLHMIPWMWRFRFWLYDDLGSLFYLTLVPLFKRYLPWTRPIWHRINALRFWLHHQAAKVYHPRRPMGWEVRQPPD